MSDRLATLPLVPRGWSSGDCAWVPPKLRPTTTGVLLSVDQSLGTVYLWHCDQVTSRRRLSEDSWIHIGFTVMIIPYVDSYRAISMPSVLWHCWLGGRKGIWPVKNWAVGCWCGYLSGARCRLAYSPADATATHCLLIQQNPDWFYLSGTS